MVMQGMQEKYYKDADGDVFAIEFPVVPDTYTEITVEEATAIANPPLTVVELKAAKTEEIDSDRDAACVANVTAHDRQWQADSRSQQLLGDAITLAQAGVPLPPVWRDADNNDMPITSVADLVAIAGAIAQQTQTAYAVSWQRKAALAAAKTSAALEAV